MSKIERTDRGFALYRAKDKNDEPFEVQQSSAIDDTERGMNQPGSSYLWFGQPYHRVHLSREHVTALVKMFQTWLDTGNLE